MKTLLNLYWNIMFYCTYTLLFYLFNRLLNPIYWLQNKKVRLRLNEYINNIVSFLNKREVDERGIDSGIIIFSTSYICAHTLCFLSFIFWLIYKITRVNVIQMAFNNMLVLSIFFVIICAVIYITNYLFLFKKNKYEFFFVKFNTDKKYTLYYGIFLFSLFRAPPCAWCGPSCRCCWRSRSSATSATRWSARCRSRGSPGRRGSGWLRTSSASGSPAACGWSS